MRAAVYLRTSSNARKREVERREVTAFVDTRGWQVTEIFVADELPRGTARGPELERMLRDARLMRFDAIVVWELACLASDSSELMKLLGQLGLVHVRLIAVRHGFDTDSGLGEAALRVASLLSKFDRQVRADHVRVGLERARAAGRRIGRPPKELDLAGLQQLRSRGSSIRQIARALGVASSTVARHLRATTTVEADGEASATGGAHE